MIPTLPLRRPAPVSPFVLLALGVWGLQAASTFGFTVAVGAHPFLRVLPFVWMLHGLVLTWPFHHAIKAAWRWPVPVRLAALAVLALAATWLQTWLDARTSMFTIVHLAPPGVGGEVLLRNPDGSETNIGVEFSFMTYFWAFASYALGYQLLRVQAARDQAVTLAQRSELQALRLQLNPHFLFNALNAVSSLIVTRRIEEAERVTLSMADFLRASLTADPGGVAPLADELEQVGRYLAIEEVRFGDRLDVVFDVAPEALSLTMPSFILQPLAENAVKYAVSPSSRPVKVTVSARRAGDRLEIVVADQGAQVGQAATPGTGTALRNIQARLAALYGAQAGLRTEQRPDGYVVTLWLPASEAPES